MIDGRAPVEWFEEIDSTMLEARRRAERGEFGPIWLIAKRQTAGRGRRGRAWVTIEGNLLATYLFEPKQRLAEIALLGFAAGLAIAETIEFFGAHRPVTLKWPNDVLIGGAKAAGILIDSGAGQGGRPWAALAFGVNVAGAPEALDQVTTSVRAELPAVADKPSAIAFFEVMRPKLVVWSARLQAEGFEPLRQAWLTRAHGLGREARVDQGGQSLTGALAGLSPSGELELDTPTGRRLISAGDVFFSSAA